MADAAPLWPHAQPLCVHGHVHGDTGWQGSALVAQDLVLSLSLTGVQRVFITHVCVCVYPVTDEGVM